MIRIILCLVVFWNVENYFDPFDDPLTNDNDFTPQGYYSWTWKRFLKKRNDLAKVLIACGQHDSGNGSGSANNSGNGSANSTWEAPCIIGLCEVENFLYCTNWSRTLRWRLLVTGLYTGTLRTPGVLT